MLSQITKDERNLSIRSLCKILSGRKLIRTSKVCFLVPSNGFSQILCTCLNVDE